MFKNRVEEAFETNINRYTIVELIKNKLKYSYKTSRTPHVSDSKLIYFQSIYAYRMLDLLSTNHILWSVDEWSFTRNVKQNYSWMPKGSSSGIINLKFKGRVTLIFAISSSGDLIGVLVNQTVTSSIFWKLLYFLCKYVHIGLNQNMETVRICLDNSSIHFTKNAQKFASLIFIKIYSIFQYCPHLSPVDTIFVILKSKIRQLRANESICFTSNHGRNAIFEASKELDNLWIRKVWGRFIIQSIFVIKRVQEVHNISDKIGVTI